MRALIEAQGHEPTLQAQLVAGLELTEMLERELDADLGRLRLIQDIFLEGDIQGAFAVWIAACFSPGRAPEFKIYLNPQARGPERAQALVEEALCRLGFPGAWAALGRAATRRGPSLDEIKYFSLDLSATPGARVKVYVHHHRATPEDLERACSEAGGYVPREALGFARAMRGSDQVLSARSPFTCHSFVSDAGDQPAATTLYVPICAYVRDDSMARDRMNQFLFARDIDPTLYNDILDGYANRKVEDGVGMQSWVAFRRHEEQARLTVYLATEANHVHAPGAIPAATHDLHSFSSAEEVVRLVARHSLKEHPFLQRLVREGGNPGLVWLLIVNAYEGTSKHFIQWLATVTARVGDDQIRCLLAHQLDEELGHGNFSHAHSVLMRSFLRTIEVLKPSDFSQAQLAPGHRLGMRLAKHYTADDEHEGVAALMAGEICASQLIRAVSELLRMNGRSFDDTKAMSWLVRHDEVEGDHADESFIMARMIPATIEAISSVQRGALGTHHALWSFLDEMYQLCFRRLPTRARARHGAGLPAESWAGR